jgi:hypothetical protein
MGWGKIMESFFGNGFGGISGKVLSGILGISLVWTLLSFFPLNIYVEIPSILLGLFYFLKINCTVNCTRFQKKIMGWLALFH